MMNRQPDASLFGDAAANPPVVITAITVLPGKGALVRVEFDRGPAARLRQGASDGLRPGLVWDEALARETLLRDGAVRAVERAMRWLKVRDRSAAELHERLLAAKFAPEVVERAVIDLKRRGLVDDSRLASAVAESLARRGAVGEALLRQKFAARKLSGADAESVLTTSAGNGDDAVAIALTRAAALRRSQPTLTKAALARRIAAWLGRRGFDDETAQTAAAQAAGLDDAELRGDGS